MAKTTAADVMMDTLVDWGVEVIFGLPGDGINGFMEALRTRKEKIKFVHVRHEESAAFMACAYAKYTGKLGVCLATSGPGGIHLLNGLYDAKFDGAPVLAITGLHFHDQLDTHAQQDVDLDKVFQDVSVYNARIMGPAHVESVTDLACRTALSYKGVAHLTMPVDFQSMEATRTRGVERKKPGLSPHLLARSASLPDSGDLEHAVDVINQGRKIAIMAGRGALGATDELLALAEKLGAPIVKPLLGKAVVPDDSIFTTGSVGLLGTRASQEVMENCDTLLMVGTSFPYLEFMPKPGQARAVQIDSNPARIGLRYPVEAGLVGDSKKTLQALLPMLAYNDHRDFLYRTQATMKDWWELMRDQGTRQDLPMKPQVVAWELGKRLKSDAIVSCDSGTIATWWARHIPAKRGQMHSLSGTLATMACGLPYAISAQIAYPNRQSVAFVGDGGFSMLMAELSTCVMYKLPVKIFVINNSTLAQIKWEQMVFLGNPEYGCELGSVNYARIAEACGATGIRLEDPADAPAVIERALEIPGPVVVDAIVDPFEPPMPAKIKAGEALRFAESLARGTPNRGKTAFAISKDIFRRRT